MFSPAIISFATHTTLQRPNIDFSILLLCNILPTLNLKKSKKDKKQHSCSTWLWQSFSLNKSTTFQNFLSNLSSSLLKTANTIGYTNSWKFSIKEISKNSHKSPILMYISCNKGTSEISINKIRI